MENAAPGKILQYHLAEKIGSGFAGDVYHAWDSGLDRNVAVRIIREELARDNSFRSQIMTAGLTARELSNLHVTRFYGVEETDGQLIAVLENVPGETLKSFVKRKRLNQIEFLKLAGQLAEGLRAIHQLGMSRRYITSDNIILSPEGDAKLTDLAVAPTVMMINNPENFNNSMKLTYLAPEFLSGRDSTHASDQYSLGIVLYESLTGRTPFGEISKDELIAVAEDENARERAFSKIPHGEIYLILSKMMSAYPEERFSNAEELIASISAVDLSQTESLKHSTPYSTSQNDTKSRLYLMVSLAFFLLVLFWLIVKGFGG